MDIEQIRILWEMEEVVFTKHFSERLNQRNINIFQVEDAIMNGIIVEERPKEKPHPKCIIQGIVERDFGGILIPVPLFVVCALSDVLILLSADWNQPRSLGQKGRRR